MEYPYCINVDWLQVFCSDKNTLRLDYIYNDYNEFEFILRPATSRHFGEIWDVRTIDGDEYAIIQRKPLSKILADDAAIVQLVNRELYKPGFSLKFFVWLARYKFVYKSISRIDLCFDSNVWAHGLKPANFVNRFLKGQYLMNSKTRLSMNFSINAAMRNGFDMNSFSFGSKTSPVFTRLYNKTKELNEVKMKPYIVENWEYNGLDTNQDVWRIEFAIKSDGAKMIHLSTGELFRLDISQLRFQEEIEDIFFSYAAKYFVWKVNDGKKNKTRMKDLDIFPKTKKTTMRPIRITSSTDSTRADRIFLKRIHKYIEELKDVDKESEEVLRRTSDIVAYDKMLIKWRNDKLYKPKKE